MNTLKNIIRKSILFKDYDKAIKFLNLYKNEDWMKYYNLAKCYKNKSNINGSLVLAKKSIDYTLKEKTDYRYLYSNWLIAECEAQLGNTLNAIEYFDICINGFELLNEFNLKLCCQFNQQKHLENIENLIDIIETYEQMLIDTSKIEYFGDMKKDTLLQTMYKDTYKLAVRKNMYTLSDLLEKKIESFDITTNLLEN